MSDKNIPVFWNTDAAEKTDELRLDAFSSDIARYAAPNVYDIVPYSVCSSEEKRARAERHFRAADLFLGPTGGRQAQQLFTSEVGASDKAWNMVTLTPILGDWMDLCYFAMKPLGPMSTPDDPDELVLIKAQMHWMHYRTRPEGEAPSQPLGRSAEKFLAAFPGPYGLPEHPDGGQGTISMIRPTGWPAWTGDIMYIKVDNKHVKDMIMAFEMRWAFCNVIAMAGGIEALRHVEDTSPFLNNDGHLPGLEAQRRASSEDLSSHGTLPVTVDGHVEDGHVEDGLVLVTVNGSVEDALAKVAAKDRKKRIKKVRAKLRKWWAKMK